MYFFFSIFLLFVISFGNIYSQSLHKEIRTGLELCYNFKWQEAELFFSKMIDKYPDRPEGYHYASGIYLWYYLGNRDKEDFDTFVEYSDKAIEAANHELDSIPKNAFTNYLLGSTYMYRAIAFTREENYLDAVWASKKSETYLNTALELDSKLSDVYLGLGLYYFAVGQIPSAFQWALSLAGIQGDKKIGVDYIKTAASHGDLAKVEAQYYLSQILSEVLFENEAALYYLNNLVRRYPNNLLFNYSYAVLELKERNLSQAEKILTKVTGSKNLKFSQIISFSNFLKGDIFFRRNQFDSAKVYYALFLDSTPSKDYTGIANYRLALSYEMTGDRENAQKYFNNCGSGNMDLEDDQFAKRKGEIFSRRKLSMNELELIRYSNLVEAGKYKAAYDSLQILMQKLKSDLLKSEALLQLSEAAYRLGKLDLSLKSALAAKEINPIDEKWIAPFATYFAARVYQMQKDTANTSDMIEQLDDYSKFDYQSKLKNLVQKLSDNAM